MKSMVKAGKRKLIWIVLDVLAAAMVIYSVALIINSNFNMGNLLVWILTVAVVCYACWHDGINVWFHTRVGHVAWCVLVAGGVLLAGMLAFVAISGHTNTATGNEQVVIVLGAGLHKDKPSTLLRYRLNKAYEYAVQHPTAVIVTTGGQGRGETMSEGQAMKDYLVEKGIASERIFAETKSTSTEENFAFAKQILEQNGISTTQAVVYVSNAFHCYRAGQYAKRAGFAQGKALPAGIPLHNVPTCYLREVFAVLYYWVFKTSATGWLHGMVGFLNLG